MRVIVVSFILILMVYVGYKSFGTPPLTERRAITSAIESAKKEKKLAKEEEVLLSVQLAVVDYQARNGMPPSSLHDLVPTYFESVPMNPETGKDFLYERVGREFKIGKQVEFARAGGGAGEGKGDVLASSLLPFVSPASIQEDTFVYDPTGKRDPFMPFDLSDTKNLNADKPLLEQIELGQLRVTAIMGRPDGSKIALVEDNAGKGFSVHVGMKMGVNSGEIVEIQDKFITIVETSQDRTGKIERKVIEKKLMSKDSVDSSSLKKSGMKRK